ncbi:MAG: Wadjet anti-phage system protein JetD domain-containing protein [Clostridiaceae bacterium]
MKMKDIRILNKKKVSLSEIEKFYKINEYGELYHIIIALVNEGILIPIKNSELNGKSPALYLSYWVKSIEEDNSVYFEEIKFKFSTKLDTSYYLKNITKYKQDRKYVLLLNEFFLKNEGKIKNKISLNERSFEIWGREKFLKSEGGKKILKNLGLKEYELNIYLTREPLAYYSHSKKVPQNILIIENKDTFYSMRKHLLEGNNEIMGKEISTLVYGGGKNINKSFEDFDVCVEPYISKKNNTILYFGDLDYEGIGIYESMKRIFENRYNIQPFVEGYMGMVDKYRKMKISLPETKEGQNRNISDAFLSEFAKEYRISMLKILEANKYIPQEILNIGDF